MKSTMDSWLMEPKRTDPTIEMPEPTLDTARTLNAEPRLANMHMDSVEPILAKERHDSDDPALM
jgi:hypothetical protein